MVGPRGERERIRVLIVDDNQDTQDNLAKMLYFERDLEVVGSASSGREGIEKAGQLSPHVVLMDINMPDMDGIRATEAIRQQAPGLPVIIMSVQEEQEYLRRAMVAGASDYLVKPFGGDELANSIRTAYARLPARPTSAPSPLPAPAKPASAPDRGDKVIAVYSPKGGVGRTTIAVNLATALRVEAGARVALVDCSLPFGDVGVMLNLVGSRSVVDLLPFIDDLEDAVLDGYMLSHANGLRVLLAPPRPELSELLTAEHVGKLLPRLRQSFDFVIVDTCTPLQEVTLAVLDHADLILVVTTLEVPAIKNMRLFLETVGALGYPPERSVVVINRADSSGGIRPQDVEERTKHRIFAQVANDWKTATIAANRGAPLVTSHRDTQIARNLLDLAKQVANRNGARETVAPARTGGLPFRFRQ